MSEEPQYIFSIFKVKLNFEIYIKIYKKPATYLAPAGAGGTQRVGPQPGIWDMRRSPSGQESLGRFKKMVKLFVSDAENIFIYYEKSRQVFAIFFVNLFFYIFLGIIQMIYIFMKQNDIWKYSTILGMIGIVYAWNRFF